MGPIEEKLARYIELLKAKIDVAPDTGFEIDPSEVNPILKPHARDAVVWGIRGGRRALFEQFGLAKTSQQLEICRIITEKKGGKALIVCPLGVRHEFKRDGMFEGEQWEKSAREAGLNIADIRAKYGVKVKYVKTMAECMEAEESVLIANYERVRDGDIDPKWFTVTSLDEASVLRSFGSLTYQTFLDKFKGVEYKYVCTATPSPNRYKELIHYSGYLEIMDTGACLTRFFKRDSEKAGNLQLAPEKEEQFWLWLSTWSFFLTKPSDIGYSDSGYAMPPMKVIYHEIPVDHGSAGAERDGQIKLVRDAAVSLQDASKEKRDSIYHRVSKMREILSNDPDSHYILWHDLEEERHAIKKAVPEAVEVYGSLDMDIREQRTIDFSDGKFKYLATKKRISGSGCNFQHHCHKAIFVGIDEKFNDFIQGIHRILRYGQNHEVEIHVIYTESERKILDDLKLKWAQHDFLAKKMTEIIKKYGLSSTNIMEKLSRSMGVKRQIETGKHFTSINNDNVLELFGYQWTAKGPERVERQTFTDNSVDLIVTSVPFGNHYEYCNSYNDFGYNEGNESFFKQMDFLTPELLRVLKPGRVAAIHVKDRILFGNATGTGMPTVDPFHASCIFHYIKHGFQFFGMITVVTDVVRENNQTYRLGWTEQCKDGTKMGVGCPEYVLLFRKLPSDTSKAYADEPVKKTKDEYPLSQWQLDAHAFWRSSGDRLLTPEELAKIPIEDLQKRYTEWSRNTVYSYKDHVKLARDLELKDKLSRLFMVIAPGSWHPLVWDDVIRFRTFNADQVRKGGEKHICPLQFDIVDRLISRYSNPGEVVYDPFAGLSTVPYRAVKLGRIGKGTELNDVYWKDGVNYMRAIEEEVSHPTLFDDLDEATA